jgi:hypothetical protein
MKSLKYVFLALSILAGMSGLASATTCGSSGGTDISNSGGTTCSLGDLTFTFQAPGFAPASSGQALIITAAAITTNDYTLDFGINPGATGFPVDVNIDYLVTSTSTNISGLDAMFSGGTSGTIVEQACTSALTGTASCPAGDTVSSLDLASGGIEMVGTPASFGPLSQVSLHENIDAIGFSEFGDSIAVSSVPPSSPVPEPSAASLLGGALCGLALVSRKLRRRKNK